MNRIFPDSQIIRIAQTASTNCYLKQLSETENLTEGTIIVTDNQTQGRGVAGNAWESAPGENLTFSVILFPVSVNASGQFILSKVISLAVYDFLSEFVSGVSVKWPNDVYVDDKKIAGILIENFVAGDNLTKTIAGIGVNINQKRFFSDAPNPVSLRQITGKTYDLDSCLQLLHLKIYNRYCMMIENTDELNSGYIQHLYRFGTPSRFFADGDFFNAVITGVNQYGMLEMTTANGELKAFGFKEVGFVFVSKTY